MSLKDWFDARFPFSHIWRQHASQYYVPKNFNFWYFFGVLATVVLVNQLISGLWLAMYYTPTAEGAFASIEMMMRDVHYGWLLRYLHSTGASAFFIVIYLHMFRGLLYGSYKKPRELVWLIGMMIYLVLVLEAFMGYLLPWGQMSYWGAQVIISLLSALPWVGECLVTWIRGDYTVSGVTLTRFFALHVIGLPLILLALVWMHLTALHTVGSNNPDGIDIKRYRNSKGHPLDGIPFHPYYTAKDSFVVGVFLCIFCVVVFFAPTMGGYFLEHINFIPADPLQTPSHIAPVWYLIPYYAMLRAVPNKLGGVITLISAMFILFCLPWLDRSPVKSIRYRGVFTRIALTLFTLAFITLCYLGTLTVTPLRTTLAQIAMTFYFAFFLLMPFYTRYEKTKSVPQRVHYP